MSNENKSPSFEKIHTWISRASTFSVKIICHKPADRFIWCMYALISDKHPDFSNVENLIEILPLHRGCTYDEILTQTPAKGIRYEWQKKRKWIEIGCDYAHLYDDYYMQLSPDDGLPDSIKSDAEKLFAYLKEREK